MSAISLKKRILLMSSLEVSLEAMDAEDAKAGEVLCEEKKKRKRMKKLQGEICQQIEFYFSDANLRKDRFLKQEMDKDKDSYINIATLATFNKVRKLTSDLGLIAKSLKHSALIQVSEDKTRIRRKMPLKEPKYNIDDLTVYVENLPYNVDHDMLRKAFASCGTVAYISLPRYKSTNDPKRFAFIEFTTPKEASNACKLLNNPPRSKPYTDGHFPTTRKGRLILPEQPAAMKGQRNGRALTKRADDHRPERKKAASETEVTSPDAERKKKKSKRAEPASEEKPSQKRKRAADGAGQPVRDEEPSDKKAKVKKEAATDRREQDGHKESRKRKHSGGEDSALRRDRSPQSDDQPRKLKDERSESKGERSGGATKSSQSVGTPKSEKRRGGDADARKRKRDDSTSSLDAPEVKRSNAGHAGGQDSAGAAEEEAEGELKKKRKNRSHKHHKEDEEPISMLQLRVIPKREWLELRKEYLAIQKASRQQIKQALKGQGQGPRQKGPRQEGHRDQWIKENSQQGQELETKPKSSEPAFVAGVVLKVSCQKPFASRKNLREQLQEISPVAYIELNDGDTDGFVRLQTAEGAEAVLGKASKITNDKDQVHMNLLAGQEEREYWDKLKADRIAKLSSKTKKTKKRGVQRIRTKSEKVVFGSDED